MSIGVGIHMGNVVTGVVPSGLYGDVPVYFMHGDALDYAEGLALRCERNRILASAAVARALDASDWNKEDGYFSVCSRMF